MANKVKCTCGHSWSKSDSSKKDMYICHICGKDTRSDIPQAQNGIEGTMGGLTDKGFNYNGAWGGPSMAMGGSLPGSVGFMYARTGSIPSNGPYAKKTKASAQNGMEMKYYQEGLDWTPKNISMNGSKLKKAQLGTHMITPDYRQVGDNIMEMLSVPQKALTALFSGKYQTPSEAMNIQNPYGAFAINAILDPTNLLGAGVLSKNLMSAGKAANKVSRMDHLKELVKMKQEGVDLSTFFENLDWTKKGKDLWNEASKYNVNILTGGRELAPGQDAISTGKRLWSKKNLNLEGDNIIVEKQKAKYANPNVILVDDLKDNVNKFREAGGHAILHTDTKKTIKELNKHMKKNPDHKVYMDLDGVLVDLEGGVGKFRGKKKYGGVIEKAQSGTKAKWQERLAEEAAKLDDPLSTLQLTKKGFSKDQIRTIQNAASKEQPVVQPKAGKQLSKEEIYRKNKDYAEQEGRRFDPNTGAVTPFLSPSTAKAFKNTEDAVLAAANYALNTPTKIVQSAYKPGYTLKDALLGKPNDASLLEDMIDPQMLATFGGKGLLKGLLKGALTKGTIGKGLLSSAALPFYKSLDPDSRAVSALASKLDQVKDLITSPEAKSAFRDVADAVTSNRLLNKLDENYVNAITNPDLPELAVDKYVNSITSIDPAENILTPEQAKYLSNITSLTTDVERISPNVSNIDKLDFLINNSQDISPRDMLPFFYGTGTGWSDLALGEGLNESDRKRLMQKLYDSYSGRNVASPFAEQTAAADLFTLADNYSEDSSLAKDITMGMEQLAQRAAAARPKTYIDNAYFNPRFANDLSEDAIYSLFRNRYPGIPSTQDRGKAITKSARAAMSVMKDILSDPSKKGKFFTGSKSLSADSFGLTLGMLAKQTGAADIVPVHGGSHFETMLPANNYGGLSLYNSQRKQYLDKVRTHVANKFGQSNTYSSRFFEEPAQRLQRQMLETLHYNTHIDKFNKAVGTNMPSALFDTRFNVITRPNVGFIPKKDGGPVKDNMGYWNPDNWGKSVEIDSNDITMQGVYQPLIGVSDEGDVQYMEPGGNYKFKGKKVTEYPVKKKSGGWLDEYE